MSMFLPFAEHYVFVNAMINSGCAFISGSSDGLIKFWENEEGKDSDSLLIIFLSKSLFASALLSLFD